jgi:hypothetical protein
VLTGRDERGQLTLLIIGFCLLAATLVVVGIDVSKVFLARRALSSVADAAALRAAQALDRDVLYAAGAGGCGSTLPLDPAAVSASAGEAVDDDLDDLRQTFVALGPPQTTLTGGTVSVRLDGDVAVPFGRLLGLLLPDHAEGRVHVSVTAAADSPVVDPDGC